ncbi:hypothetical protein G7046_g2125 [Stylonectria norvegica]|nr:hypothetical protein G7046_g2125 [Stylonectria norvegica]
MPPTTNAKIWKAEEVLPKADQTTKKCKGYATSKRRPCEKPIGKPRIRRYLDILDKLSHMTRLQAMESPLLKEAALESLCVHHVHEADDLVKKWKASIKEAEAEEAKKLKEELQKRMNSTIRAMKTNKVKSNEKIKSNDKVAKPSPTLLAPAAKEPRKVSQRDDIRSQQKVYSLPSPPPSPAARRVSEAPASYRRPTVPVVVEDSDDETAGHNPINDRDLGMEDSDDDETDDDSAEEKDTDHAANTWMAYETKWVVLEQYGRVRGIPVEDQIPWPVSSGRARDVNADEVRAFFNLAAPRYTTKVSLVRMILTEYDRWEAKSVKKMFGRHIFDGMFAKELKTIFEVVQQCTQEVVS